MKPLVAGIGCASRAELPEIAALLDAMLAETGCSPDQLGLIASIDTRRGHPALHALAARFGAQLRFFPATALAAEPVPPSAFVAQRTGTGSVAEAAARLCGELIAPKKSSALATCALARIEAKP